MTASVTDCTTATVASRECALNELVAIGRKLNVVCSSRDLIDPMRRTLMQVSRYTKFQHVIGSTRSKPRLWHVSRLAVAEAGRRLRRSHNHCRAPVHCEHTRYHRLEAIHRTENVSTRRS